MKNSRYVNDKDEPMILIVKNKPETPNPGTLTGGYNFVKTDNSKEKRLKGAKFKVQKKIDGKYYDLDIDRKPITDKSKALYTVTSDENGKFSVDGLPYEGDDETYYLKEIEAPSGFTPYESAIPFTVNAASKDKQPHPIENYPKVVITKETPTTKITRQNTVTTDYTPTGVTKIIRGPIVKTGDIRILIMAVIGLILLITGVKLVRSAEKPRIA